MEFGRLCRAAILVAALSAGSATVSHAEEFVCPEGAKDSGSSPETHPGTIVRWCEITRDGRLLYHGPVWRWHRNGQLEGKEYYINGNAEGEWESWSENGNRASLGTFRNGGKTGRWTYWFDSGSLRAEVTYGEDANDVVHYYPNGERRSAGRFWRGGKIGQWTYWDSDGTEKARCDFGAGLFELPDEACRIIADELRPRGFSRPVPVVSSNEGESATIRIASLSYGFDIPSGWKLDEQAGKDEGIPLVLYPDGGTWRGEEPNIYFRILFRDGRSFEEIVELEGQRFSQNVAEYDETSLVEGRTIVNRSSIIKMLSYKPLIRTDSPFAIVAENSFYEAVSFLDVSDQLVLMAVLACRNEAQRKESGHQFRALISSLRLAP